MRCYRIHSGTESLETLLNADRKDGWVASDESAETQAKGISCCESLDALASYISMYSLNIQPGDVLVELVGQHSYDSDRDQGAVRLIVERFEVLGNAAEWLASFEG